ncbi:hypothetical protein [Vibrio mangrovi]|uniref:Uncharacterized protein n=1 Tax=Vibrio mangrovi TaxID=474394 RepID=A0A1Y6J126_9VIBR|nr:hypothetical protein [Vibrio mangrovi]MDW6005325.1 hypothetical protein [Vibrio mangrovi]SMS02951.1 hypothetical protein VIM7927_04313 [Vibrio mangrovi]
MIAKIIKVADEEGLPTYLEIEGKVYEAMDCIGYQKAVTEGEIIDVELSVGIDDEDETFEQIFDGNPDCIEELSCTGGWSYKAYGFIKSVDPVVVSCGSVQINEPFEISDESLIGEYIAFNIVRLDVWAV